MEGFSSKQDIRYTVVIIDSAATMPLKPIINISNMKILDNNDIMLIKDHEMEYTEHWIILGEIIHAFKTIFFS